MVEYPGIWYFYLMSQHRFHNVKKKKKKVGQKCSLLDKKTKLCNFAQREKKQPLNVTSILSFLLAENGRLFMTCICKLVLPKYKHCFFFTPDNFCCYSYC